MKAKDVKTARMKLKKNRAAQKRRKKAKTKTSRNIFGEEKLKREREEGESQHSMSPFQKEKAIPTKVKLLMSEERF